MTSSKKKIHLNDLNHDPSLLDALTDEQIVALNSEAHESDIPLGGNIRTALNERANAVIAGREEN